jgi:hypothetical protein
MTNIEAREAGRKGISGILSHPGGVSTGSTLAACFLFLGAA